MSKTEITLGSDPEFVLLRDGKPISAIDVFKREKDPSNKEDHGVSTKDYPIDLGNGVMCYADNALLEARFSPVSLERITFAVGDMIRRLHKFVETVDSSLSITPIAAMKYHSDQLRHPLNWQAGCSPTYSAYREIGDNQNPATKFTDNLRTGSFHIHIGNKNFAKAKESDFLMSMEQKVEAIKLLDLYLGTASVVFDRDSSAYTRRNLYGKAGEFRPTEYGVEYRVLGPYCSETPRLVRLVYNLVDHAMDVLDSGGAKKALAIVPEKDIQEIINRGMREEAQILMEKIGLPAGLFSEVILHPGNEVNSWHSAWC